MPTAEALPRPTVHRRATRSSIGEPPGGEEPFLAGPGRYDAAGRGRLPRILTGLRVLVVDDDEDSAQLFVAALSGCGAEVVAATGAPEALRALAARAADIVVTDIAMPRYDGYWLVREIRQLEDARVRTVPVLAVTAFSREHFRDRALAAGFVDHLEKPVDPEVLCRAVARASGR
jgi:CheY-like chemotaxis protein